MRCFITAVCFFYSCLALSHSVTTWKGSGKWIKVWPEPLSNAQGETGDNGGLSSRLFIMEFGENASSISEIQFAYGVHFVHRSEKRWKAKKQGNASCLKMKQGLVCTSNRAERIIQLGYGRHKMAILESKVY